MFNIKSVDIPLDNGRVITLETGKLAKQTDGSVVVKMGKTILLATVVSAKEAREDVDFMPLSVEYREQFAALGRFPGGFLRREGRPSDNEILTSRLVDRALRPLFPKDYHADTFVNIVLLSGDKDDKPDSLAGLAASAALTISDIPFHGPISEVRVARINGQFMVNPPFEENESADIDMIVGATIDNVLMVEGEMDEVSEAEMVEAIEFAHAAIKKQCQAQLDLAEKVGKKETREYQHEEESEDLMQLMHKETYDKVYAIAGAAMTDKHERKEAFNKIKEEFIEKHSTEEEPLNELMVERYFHDIEKEAVRNLILNENKRLDGRGLDEIRPINIEVDYLPSTHGSALFTRGETQALASVTLGTKLDEKIVDNPLEQGKDKFLLHYNFPPFSTGDARPVRGVSRREIGHGNLAHRALKGMIPSIEDNPYAIRIVSDILESNGSSSMATVCAGSLALMDSGVKTIKPVSGIAMGLITEGKKYAILSDILGDEDHLGDMDFKVTGTIDGITACQMDIKVEGLKKEILENALEQAKKGRHAILTKMNEILSAPRPDYKPHAPRIQKITVPKEFIGAIIGPGGKVIQEIQNTTGTTIVIEEVGDVGVVEIVSSDQASIEEALERIKAIVAIPEIGKVYKGKVKSIVNFGAFIEILPNKEGLLHISEIEWRRLRSVDEVLKVGQEIEVKLLDIDREGKLKLSRKALLPRPQKNKPE